MNAQVNGPTVNLTAVHVHADLTLRLCDRCLRRQAHRRRVKSWYLASFVVLLSFLPVAALSIPLEHRSAPPPVPYDVAFGVLTAIAALMIPVAITVGNATRRIRNSRDAVQKSADRPVELDQLGDDVWQRGLLLFGNVFLCLCMVVSSSILCLTTSTWVAIAALLVTTWGALTFAGQEVVYMEANLLIQRIQERNVVATVESRVKKLAPEAGTPEATRAQHRRLLASAAYWLVLVTAAGVAKSVQPRTTSMHLSDIVATTLSTAIIGLAILLAARTISQDSIYQAGTGRALELVLYSSMVAVLAGGSWLISAMDQGTNDVTALATAVVIAATGALVTAGHAGSGPMMYLARSGVPLTEPSIVARVLGNASDEAISPARPPVGAAVICAFGLTLWISAIAAVINLRRAEVLSLAPASTYVAVAFFLAPCILAVTLLGWTVHWASRHAIVAAYAALIVLLLAIVMFQVVPDMRSWESWLVAVLMAGPLALYFAGSATEPRVPGMVTGHQIPLYLVALRTRTRLRSARQRMASATKQTDPRPVVYGCGQSDCGGVVPTHAADLGASTQGASAATSARSGTAAQQEGHPQPALDHLRMSVATALTLLARRVRPTDRAVRPHEHTSATSRGSG